MSEHDQAWIELAAPYALGALDPDERRRFEAHLGGCAICQAEVAAFRRVTAGAALATDAVEPPAALRGRVIAAATGDRTRASAGPQRAPRIAWLAAAAALLIAAAAGLYAFYQRTALTGMRQAAVIAADEARQLRAQLARARMEAQQLSSAIALLSAADLQRVDLATSAPAAPSGRAFVSRSRGLLVSTSNLPALAPGRAYQLWLVVPNRPPIGAGLFTLAANGSGVIVAPAALSADVASSATLTLAITNEPAAGSPAPTTPIVLAGTARMN
jgi:anti-sigma-K factor RskA